MKQRACESDHPGEAAEQQDAGEERQAQTNLARLGLLIRRQFSGQDGNEDDVVDAQDYFEHRERQQTDPDFGVGKPVHGGG